MKIIETPIQPELEEIRWQRSPIAINHGDIKKIQSNISGLSYIPTFGDNRDDIDLMGGGKGAPYDHITNTQREFSYFDQYILRKYLKRQQAQKSKISILEIGVCAAAGTVGWNVGRGSVPHETSTHILLSEKRPEDLYLGIDINDKSVIDMHENNIYTIKENSSNIDIVIKKFREIGGDKIDYIFIDGYHSINQVLKEWGYSNFLSEIGVMVFHDTNVHPGPYLIMEAIDEKIYDVIKYGTDLVDWGIGVVILKNNLSIFL